MLAAASFACERPRRGAGLDPRACATLVEALAAGVDRLHRVTLGSAPQAGPDSAVREALSATDREVGALSVSDQVLVDVVTRYRRGVAEGAVVADAVAKLEPGAPAKAAAKWRPWIEGQKDLVAEAERRCQSAR